MKTIVLGATMRDQITGFTGVVTGHVKYISGCHQSLIVPRVREDGSLIGAEWFDDQRLEYLENDVVQLDNGATPGCDKPAPIR